MSKIYLEQKFLAIYSYQNNTTYPFKNQAISATASGAEFSISGEIESNSASGRSSYSSSTSASGSWFSNGESTRSFKKEYNNFA